MAKYKFNIKCGAKLTSVEIEADTYEDALKEVKKQAIRFKGNKVDTKFDKNKLDTRDASGIHKITYVDIDGNKVEEIIKGDKSLVDKRYSELKNHDCKILKIDLFLNWKNVKDSNDTDKYNDKFVNKLKKDLESKKSLSVSFEDYAGTQYDFEKAVKKANLKCKPNGGGNFVITKDAELAWQEFNKSDKVVTKRKEFKDKESRDKFINKLVEKDNFYTILGTRDSSYAKHSKTFFSEKEAKKFKDELEKQSCKNVQIWSGKDGFGQTNYIVKWTKDSKSFNAKDSKPFEVDKTIMHEKDANGKMLYLVKSGLFYVTTSDPTGHGGGIFDVNLKNAQETFKSTLLMIKLEKKYGKQEAYKRYLRGDIE